MKEWHFLVYSQFFCLSWGELCQCKKNSVLVSIQAKLGSSITEHGFWGTTHAVHNNVLIRTARGRRQSWLFPANFGSILDCFGLFKTKSWLSPADASSHCRCPAAWHGCDCALEYAICKNQCLHKLLPTPRCSLLPTPYSLHLPTPFSFLLPPPHHHPVSSPSARFYTVDGTRNDLPIQLTALSYPTVLVFPENRCQLMRLFMQILTF